MYDLASDFDILLTCHEDEDIARRKRQVNLEHLLHGAVVELQKGDILGHEFCGVVDEVGSQVTKFKKGYVNVVSSCGCMANASSQRVVASFQIACGDCYYCKQKRHTFNMRNTDSSSATKMISRWLGMKCRMTYLYLPAIPWHN